MARGPNGRFVVETAVDATGVQPGIDTTKDGLEDVGAAAQAAGAAGESAFTNLHQAVNKNESSILTSRRSVRHMLEGLLELEAGGVPALGGLATEGFLAAEAFEAMLGPLYPIIAAVTLIGSIGIPMIEKWASSTSKAKGETKDAAEEERKFAEESDKLADKRVAAIARIVSAFDTLLDKEQGYNRGLEDESRHTQQALDDNEKLIAADNKLAVAKLENQRQVALGNAKSAEEVRAITEKYDALIQGTKSQSDADILAKKVTASAQEIGDKVGEQDRVGYSLKDAEDERARRQQAIADAAKAAGDLGVHPEDNGSFTDIRKLLQAELHDAIESFKANPNDQRARTQVSELGPKVTAAVKADDLTRGLADSKIDETISGLNKQFIDLGAEVAHLTAANKVLQTEQQIAAQEADTAQKKAAQAAADAAAKDAYETQKAKLEAALNDIRTKGRDPTLTDDQKAQNSAQGADMEAQIAQLQLDKGGLMSEAERTRLRNDVKDDRQDAVYDIDKGQKKDATADQKADSAQIKNLAGQIEATGNKPMIEALKRVRDAFAGKTDEASQLQELAQLFQIHLGNYSQYQAKTAAALDEIRRRVKSSGNGNNH